MRESDTVRSLRTDNHARAFKLHRLSPDLGYISAQSVGADGARVSRKRMRAGSWNGLLILRLLRSILLLLTTALVDWEFLWQRSSPRFPRPSDLRPHQCHSSGAPEGCQCMLTVS